MNPILDSSKVVKISILEYTFADKGGVSHFRFLCPYCSAEFGTKTDRRSHVEARHQDEEAPPR